jgi:hypothetical protein
MNARIERMMNSENLGARIMWNGALDRKMWALEAFKGRTVFSRGSRGWHLLNFRVAVGSWCNRIGDFVVFGDFCGILEGLEWFRT